MINTKKSLFILIVVIFSISLSSLAVAYNESPILKELVDKGELEPVAERLPEDPYVVEPVDRVGDYGGILYSAALGSYNGLGEDMMIMPLPNSFLKPGPDARQTLPHLANRIENSDDMTTFTIHMRKGVKWSDGNPFTSEDVMFWFNDIILNEDLTPAIGSRWKSGGELMEVTQVDDYTVEIKFANPKPYFRESLVHGGHIYQPKHYLKDFHPEYTSQSELNEKIEAAGFENWYELFDDKRDQGLHMPLKVGMPTLLPYKPVEVTSSMRIYERNPYFWKVDSEGNQLPYIDRIETEILSAKEVLYGKVISGDVDFAAIHMSIKNYPMLKQYEQKGGYRTLLWTSGFGSPVTYQFNLTHEDPVLREIFQDVRFRRAMSLGINREEINNSLYFGRAEPRQFTVIDTSKYFEPEFATSYIEYDPEKANQLLDEMGLDKRDREGYRVRPDGKRLQFVIEYSKGETQRTPNVELVVQYWKDLGIDVESKMISAQLQMERAPANMMDAMCYQGDTATDILFHTQPDFYVPHSPGWEATIWPLWESWVMTDGKEGEEPPAEIKQLIDWWKVVDTEPDEDIRIELNKNILRSQAENLWSLGTVGSSPWPVVVDSDLKNVPEDGLWVWDTYFSCSKDPSQFFFENGENKE